jgi:uncharacterized protein with HEPN domain
MVHRLSPGHPRKRAKAQRFSRDSALDAFKADEKTQYAIARALEIIGEAAKRVPKDFRARYPEIPWREMPGMRDVLVHQYEGVSAVALFQTATREIDIVLERLPQSSRMPKTNPKNSAPPRRRALAWME